MRAILLLLLLPVVPLSARQQPGQAPAGSHEFRVALSPADSLIQLPHRFLIPRSEIVLLEADSGDTTSRQLVRGSDYEIVDRTGVLRLLAPPPAGRSLVVRYRIFPISIDEEYRATTPLTPRIDSASESPDTVFAPAAGFTLDDVFGPNLQKTGSLVRGFTVGSNRDLTLNSGFRLQMAGELAEDLSVTASLTDENTPIQPEGATQTIQELDRVFVELRGGSASAALGDIPVTTADGQFGKLRRKVRGAAGNVSYGGGNFSGATEAAGAVNRGKFTTNVVQGIEGNQGPYRLTGENGEYPIIVVAGTERVYLDGAEVVRGRLNDYTIDYGLAEVTFTSRVRISFASRITVEFEYTDRYYDRNLVMGRTAAALGEMGGGWRVTAMAAKEWDDEEGSDAFTPSESEREVIRGAGDDRNGAAVSGIDSVGPGAGQYLLADTTVALPGGGLVDTTVLVFAPGDTVNAVYRVTFSFVGTGSGDYVRVSAGNYAFAGLGGGDYLPVRYLPLPESHLLADFGLTGELAKGLTLGGEYARSTVDANTVSGLGEEDNNGGAGRLHASYRLDSAVVAGLRLHGIAAGISGRRREKTFQALDRVDEVEFARNWNLPAYAGDEALDEASLSVSPLAWLTLSGSGGLLDRGDDFDADRVGFALAAGNRISYRLDDLTSTDRVGGKEVGWMRQSATAAVPLGRFTPRASVQYEDYAARRDSGGAPLPETFRLFEIVPGAQIDSLGPVSLFADVGYRRDDSLGVSGLERAATTVFETFGFRLGEWNALTSQIDLRYQTREFPHAEDERSLLARWQARYGPWRRALDLDLFYEALPGRGTALERIFTLVPVGTGTHDYAGDLNGNRVVDAEDFVPSRYGGSYVSTTLPAGPTVPIVHLNTSARLRLSMERLLDGESGLIVSILSPLSTESYWRIEEKSADSVLSNVYLLRTETFRDPATTLFGSNFISQDFALWETSPVFTLRFRYLERKSFARLAYGDQTAYGRQRGARMTWGFTSDVTNETEYFVREDESSVAGGSATDRSVLSNTFSTEFFYRPIPEVESSFLILLRNAENYEISSSDVNDQRLTLSYAFRGTGKLRGEVRREEAVVRNPGLVLPYELTDGRPIGKTWILRLGFEYRIAQFLELRMDYEGRKENRNDPLHTATAEVRAFF